jgi:serine/threonine protein kinase
MTVAAGTKLARYEIRSQLGVGGMGEVYLAQDTKLDRKVALNILPHALLPIFLLMPLKPSQYLFVQGFD